MLDKLVERGKTMAVLFIGDGDDSSNADVLQRLERIDDDCARCDSIMRNAVNIGNIFEELFYFRHDINFVRVNDEAAAAAYGVRAPPGLLYFENKIPSVFDGDLEVMKVCRQCYQQHQQQKQ